VAPGEQDKTADRSKAGCLSREANTVMRRPPPAPEGTGPSGRLALSARSSDGTASAFARFRPMHPGWPPSRPRLILGIGSGLTAERRMLKLLFPARLEDRGRGFSRSCPSRPPRTVRLPWHSPTRAGNAPSRCQTPSARGAVKRAWPRPCSCR